MVSMSTKALQKVEIIGKLAQKVINQTQASDILSISDRQVRGLLKAYQKYGAEGLISRKRGNPSNRQLSPGKKELIEALIKKHYHDFGPTLAHEKITEVHKVQISLGSIRNIMIAQGLWVDKRVKKQRVYQLRKRKEQEEELVQMDESPRDWFEGRGILTALLFNV
jgi:hypothetical protein